jgi:hypothetical protein
MAFSVAKYFAKASRAFSLASVSKAKVAFFFFTAN